MELGLVIGKGGRDITQANADAHIAGYSESRSLRAEPSRRFTDSLPLSALAVDMTARNLQEEVKKKGLPWSAVKGFDTFTPIG